MITTTRTSYEGRTYDVVTDSDKADQMFSQYVQVYRVRLDGSRGAKITGCYITWQIWNTLGSK